MPKIKKRKLPITAQNVNIITKNSTRKKAETAVFTISGAAGNSNLKRNTLIREYHLLNKKLAATKRLENELGSGKNACKKETTQKLKELKEQEQDILGKLEQLGGLDAYQKQSLTGQSRRLGGDTSRWLVSQLFRLGILPPKTIDKDKDKDNSRFLLLEVGAVSPFNYTKELKWVNPVCIDLNSQHPKIHQFDFLDVPLCSSEPTSDNNLCGPFDIISLSLVVNFEGDISKRGAMLVHAANLLVEKSGLLFFVLPLPCLSNSRYFDHSRLISIMESLGMECLASHNSSKLAHYLFRLVKRANTQNLVGQFPKALINNGPGRNNFCIRI